MSKITYLIEDELEEALPYGVLIPVTITRKADGEVVAACYPQVVDAVRRELSACTDPLSSETISALILACTPFATAHGAPPMPYSADNYYVTYEMEAPQMPCMVADAELRPVTCADFHTLANLTEFEPDFDGHMMGIVKDGAICAVAAENPYAPDGTAEVNVCTAPAHRGKGYATACVSGLTRMLFADGVSYITYQCEATNRSSLFVAEKAGFTKKETYYPVLCYLDED